MSKNNQVSLNFLLDERKFALNASAVDVCWALIVKIWQELFLSVVNWRLLLFSNPNPNSKTPLATLLSYFGSFELKMVALKGSPIFFFQPIWACFYVFHFQWIGCVNSVNLKLILE